MSMNNIKFFSCCFLALVFFSCRSQSFISYQNKVFETGKVLYKNNDTITFVHNKADYSVEKPNLFFLQGSLPRPIIFDINDSTSVITPLSNFRIKGLIKKYNIFIISRPFTPLRKSIKELNSQYLYAPNLDDPFCYDTNYQKSNYLDYSAKRISYFIDKVQEKHKSNSKELILIGHSQGAIEAAKVSVMNKKVTMCVLLSTNPFGRIKDVLLSNRIQFEAGKIDSLQYVEEKNKTYQYWQEVIKNPEEISCYGDPSKTTISFSQSMIPNLLETDAKIYFGIGSLDAGSYLVDLIPLYFIENKKQIPTIKIYQGLDHNFFPIQANGTPDYKNGKWGFVMDDILKWIDSNTKN